MELDDDVFFADLSKRIALLIAEDDDEENTGLELPFAYPPVSVQGYALFPQVMIPPAHVYEFRTRKESRGTGVFIPKSSLPKTRSCKSNCKAGSPHYRTISAASQFCSISSCNQSHHQGIKKLNG